MVEVIAEELPKLEPLVPGDPADVKKVKEPKSDGILDGPVKRTAKRKEKVEANPEEAEAKAIRIRDANRRRRLISAVPKRDSRAERLAAHQETLRRDFNPLVVKAGVLITGMPAFVVWEGGDPLAPLTPTGQSLALPSDAVAQVAEAVARLEETPSGYKALQKLDGLLVWILVGSAIVAIATHVVSLIVLRRSFAAQMAAAQAKAAAATPTAQ